MNIDTPTIIDTIIKRIESQIGMSIEKVSSNYYFRGENGKFEEDYSTSSLYRVMNSQEKKNLEAFKRKMLILGESIEEFALEKDNLIRTMVRLRHEGICTPIIDFSESLLTALFFACLPSEENGYIKLFSKKNFILKNYKDFNENIYHYSLLTGTTPGKPIIIKNVNSAHPNIRKQNGVLCFSLNGMAICEKPIPIEVMEKQKIIDELNKLRINTKTLFSGQEGITTSIILDANESQSLAIEHLETKVPTSIKNNQNIEKRVHEDKIWPLFNSLLKSYNKTIGHKCSTDLLTFEEKIIITKNCFKDIQIHTNSRRDIEMILKILELEHYLSHKKNNMLFNIRLSLQDLQIEIERNLFVEVFNPNRILFTDKLLTMFSKLVWIIPEYLTKGIFRFVSPFPCNVFPFTFNKNSNQEKQLNKKRKEIFKLVIEEWLLFLKENQDYRIYLKGSSIFNVIIDILNITNKRHGNETLASFLKQFAVIILLLSYHPYDRYKVFSGWWDSFFEFFDSNISKGNKKYFEFNTNVDYSSEFIHRESYNKKNSEKEMHKVFSSIRNIK